MRKKELLAEIDKLDARVVVLTNRLADEEYERGKLKPAAYRIDENSDGTFDWQVGNAGGESKTWDAAANAVQKARIAAAFHPGPKPKASAGEQRNNWTLDHVAALSRYWYRPAPFYRYGAVV